jgi:hypothetical protein
MFYSANLLAYVTDAGGWGIVLDSVTLNTFVCAIVY